MVDDQGPVKKPEDEEKGHDHRGEHAKYKEATLGLRVMGFGVHQQSTLRVQVASASCGSSFRVQLSSPGCGAFV